MPVVLVDYKEKYVGIVPTNIMFKIEELLLVSSSLFCFLFKSYSYEALVLGFGFGFLI